MNKYFKEAIKAQAAEIWGDQYSNWNVASFSASDNKYFISHEMGDLMPVGKCDDVRYLKTEVVFTATDNDDGMRYYIYVKVKIFEDGEIVMYFDGFDRMNEDK